MLIIERWEDITDSEEITLVSRIDGRPSLRAKMLFNPTAIGGTARVGQEGDFLVAGLTTPQIWFLPAEQVRTYFEELLKDIPDEHADAR